MIKYSIPRTDPVFTLRCLIPCLLGVAVLTGCDGRKPEVAAGNGKAESSLKKRRGDPRSGAEETVISSVRLSGGNAKDSQTEFAAMAERVRDLNSSRLTILLEELSDSRDSPQDRAVFEVAIKELANRDPSKALSFYSSAKMMESSSVFGDVAEIAGRIDKDALSRWIRDSLGKCPAAMKGIYTNSAYYGLSLSDPQGAMDSFLGRKMDPASLFSAVQGTFYNFGIKDPAAAQAAAVKNLKGENLQVALYCIALGAAKADPKQGLDVALQIKDPETKGKALASIMNSWLESDPDAFGEKLNSFEAKDLQFVLRNESGDPSSHTARLAKSNPELLFSTLEKMILTNESKPIFAEASRALFLTQPDRVMGLITTMPEGRAKTDLLVSTYNGWAEKDASGALGSALRLQNQADQMEVLRGLGDRVGSEGLAATLKLSESLSPILQQMILVEAFPGIASRDIQEAADLLADPKGAASQIMDKQRQVMVADVAERMAGSDTESASLWATKLPESDRPSVMEGIANKMVKSDIEGLADMLGKLPRDKTWEAGAKVLVQTLKGTDVEMAKEWERAIVEAGF